MKNRAFFAGMSLLVFSQFSAAAAAAVALNENE
jgi:Skp family chaperone for outer membrane proteins